MLHEYVLLTVNMTVEDDIITVVTCSSTEVSLKLTRVQTPI